MTSAERHEARYLRRKQKRLEKQKKLNEQYGNFDEIYSFDNLCDSYYECTKGVAWKESTQKYGQDLFKNTYLLRQDIYNGENIAQGFHKFTLRERGKERHIRSVHIRERVAQKTLNRNCLLPILQNSLIYDNGASLKGKGIDFTNQRLTKHLCNFYREYGRDGYILLIDFSKYFDNIQHQPIFDDLERKIFDKRIIDLTKQFIVPFGEKSLGLGSETSQILAINYANPIDHYCKEVLRIHGYGRYMDDTYLIHHSKEYLKHCLEEITKICDKLGIQINKNKTQIVKLTHQFTFLKTKYRITETGKIIRRVCRNTVTRMRRKLKKFVKFFDMGLMTMQDVIQPYQSYRGYLQKKHSHKTLESIDKLFHSLFDRRFMTVYLDNLVYGEDLCY